MTRIDVSSHRNPEGKLYMPSYPWGVKMFKDSPVLDSPPREIGSDSAKNKVKALEKAEIWCAKGKWTSAIVFKRSDGEVVAHYSRQHDDQVMKEHFPPTKPLAAKAKHNDNT